MRKLTIFALLTLATTTSAASLSDAQKLFDQGKWQEAATLAQGLNSAAGYALAAQSNSMGATLAPTDQKKALWEKAQGLADQGLKLDPNSAGANFEKARAMGRLVQYSGSVLQSLSQGKEMKRLLDKTLSINPRYAAAYVALGLWNAELAAKGKAATFMTGASVNNVVPNFERAVKLEPNNLTHRYEYANALLTLGSGNKAAAVAQLQKAVSMAPTDFWTKQDQEAAKAKLASLK